MIRKASKGDNSFLTLLGLILFIIFIVRFFSVLKGSETYTKLTNRLLLNIGLPIVRSQMESDESNESDSVLVKDACISALGIKNFNFFTIIGSELKFFKDDNKINNNSSGFTLNPFKVSEETVIRIPEENLSNENLKKPLDNSKPEVFIYHTHTTEGYSDGGAQNGNENTNVVGVGSLVEKLLEEQYGIAVIHDKTNYSTSYDDSYNKSREGLSTYLNKYPNLKMVIDLHRDGIAGTRGETININGESTAKLMFVNCKNNPRYSKESALVNRMNDKANELFPGLFKTTHTYQAGKNKFNQDLHDNSLLIEVGSNLNSSSEALATAKYIARLIAEEVNKK